MTVAVVKWWRKRTEPWNPTPAQEEAVFRLAAGGGYVRTFADGTAGLRTWERGGGGLRSYIIREDGHSTLIESPPRSRRYAWGLVVGWGGLLLVVGMIPLGYFLYGSSAWVRVSLYVFIGLGMAAGWFLPLAIQMWDARPPRGERWRLAGFHKDSELRRSRREGDA